MALLNDFSQKNDDDELREYCLQACEAFVLKCPEKIARHIDGVRSFIIRVSARNQRVREIFLVN